MGNLFQKKTLLIISIIFGIGFLFIYPLSGINLDNKETQIENENIETQMENIETQIENENNEIQIENENFKIYSNQPYPQQIVDGCKDDVHCAINSLRTLSKIEDKEKVLELFPNLITSFESENPCHEVGHHLGMWLNAYVGDTQIAVELAKQQCGGAVFHGVIQNSLQIQKFNNVPLNDIDIQEVCSTFKDDASFINRWQCLHGVGHGLSDIYDYDIQSALNRCDEFEPGLEQISCGKGVFMQNAVQWSETKTGDFDEIDLYYPCNASPLKYMPTCYHYHIGTMSIKSGGVKIQIYDAFDICDKISPEEMIKYCYYGMGRMLHQRTFSDWDRALFLCQLGDRTDLYSYCIEGMLMILVNGNDDPSVGFSLCKGLPLDYKQTCYNGIGKWITMLSSDFDEQQKLCSMAENDTYSDVCMNAKTDSLLLL